MAYIGNTVENQGFTPAIDYFNGNGVTVTFTLSRPIASVAQVIVAVDNVIQNPSSAFNVVGNSITFTSAPLSGTNNIWVEYTSLITTYQGISQDPTVIGDIRATGGYLAEGDFGNSFIDGAILDYVTGAGRVTVGELDDLIFYHGGTAGRSEMMKVSYAGNSTLVGNLTTTGTLTTSSRGIAKASMPTGSVLQVITDTQPGEQSTTSSSFVDTALSITITPTSATSKIFLLYTGSAGNDGAQESYLTLVRNSTNLGSGTSGMMRVWFNGSGSYHFSGMSMSFLDSPATTSATTYKVQFRTNSGIVYISGGNSTDSLTVFEIAG